MTMTKWRQLRYLTNAFMLGASVILLADDPSSFHGFMLGIFLMMVTWNVCDLLAAEES